MFIKRAGILFFATIITISTLSGCSLSQTEKDDVKIDADVVNTEVVTNTPKKEVALAKGFKKEIVPIIESSKIIYSVSDDKTSDTILTSKKDVAEIGKYYSNAFKDIKDSNITSKTDGYIAQGEKDGYSFDVSVLKLIQGEDKSQISITITKK